MYLSLDNVIIVIYTAYILVISDLRQSILMDILDSNAFSLVITVYHGKRHGMTLLSKTS